MSETHELLRKYSLQRPPEAQLLVAEEAEELDELPAYGWRRGVNDRSAMLEFRFKNGTCQALGYPWLFKAEFDPSRGVVLNFTSYVVTMVGRNLRDLYSLIQRHRVVWVQESDAKRDIAASETAVIHSISVAALKEI